MKDGKIHLHKLNGVKIAVVVAKMAVEDLEYVERVTGVSLDDEKPLSDIRRRSLQAANKDDREKSHSSSLSKPEGSAEKRKLPEANGSGYDWFDFFLKAGVSPYLCERYANNFHADSMDETILPDITPSVLRTLGLKEGDILRVTKFLDSKYGRGPNSKLRNVSFGGEELIRPEDTESHTPVGPAGGLFSGPGGALRNNTRKGRPAPPVQTDDDVDAAAFRQKEPTEITEKVNSGTQASTPVVPVEKKAAAGFDDDAWDVKPSRKPSAAQPVSAPSVSVTAAPSQPSLTGAFAELSLLSEPLQPTIIHSNAVQQGQSMQSQSASQSQSQQQNSVPGQSSLPHNVQQSTNVEPRNTATPLLSPANTNNQLTFPLQQIPQPNSTVRQRPQPPQIVQSTSFMLPPPPRPLSAPQNVSQQQGFGPSPLQPQLTGVQNQLNLQSHVMPSGQSLNELEQVRLQHLQGLRQNYPQPAGFSQPNPGYGQYALGVQQTGIGPQFQVPQQHQRFPNSSQFLGGQQTGSPFADPIAQQPTVSFGPQVPQMTGYMPPPPAPLQAQSMGSINSYLPPALLPQATGANGLAPGVNGYANQAGFVKSQPPPPPPTLSSLQPPLAPLQPQKTGPAPPIKFGVGDTKKLVPQVTGRRANLSQASKCQDQC